MDQILCATCGKPLTEEQYVKGRQQHRTLKYCSTTCWGKRERVHNYDHTFLDTDTELAAYWVGWWCADGYFTKDGYTIAITTVDEQLMNDFVKRINYTNTVSKNIRCREEEGVPRKPEYVIRLAGNVLTRIQEMGYAPGAKGGKEFFPARFYNEQFFFHFTRGFWDGDGTVHRLANGSLSISAVNMSYKLLEQIHSWLYDRKIVRGGALLEIRPDFYRLQFGHFDTIQICQRMYENATIKLERKYQIYLANKDFVQGCTPQTNTLCSVEGCLFESIAKGLCKSHYDRQCSSRYYAEHKEEVLEKGKIWKDANRDHVNELRRESYATNPEKYRESSKKWREENRDKVQEYKRAYRKEHKDEVNAYKRELRLKDIDVVRVQEKAAYERNKAQKSASAKERYQRNKEKVLARTAAYRAAHKEERKEYDKARQDAKKAAKSQESSPSI